VVIRREYAPSFERTLAAQLSEHYRDVLELRFLDGCSIAETARALGISVGNVKIRSRRGQCAGF
jgi:DNA-directed RNA polymerase specialized sigma24 family protein